jgi:leader peptidase (prepilin peptidase)/N-methyltransferase
VKGITINAVIYCLFASALLALSVIDWRTYEIPEGINLFIAVLGLIHGILDYINWKEYGLGIFSVSLVLLIIYWITKGRGIGGGDIKLMAASGLLLGWKLNLLGFFLGCLLGSVIHLTRMKLCKTGHILALGPYLSAGLMIALMAGEPIIQWYVGLFI